MGWREVIRPEWIPSLTVMLGGILLHSMNVMLVATVLPSIVEEVGGAPLMSWAMSAFLASSIVAATCTGAVTARVGARGAFALGAAIFGVATLACALAPSMPAFVAARAVQGLGGGVLAAVSYVLVRQTFPERLWPRVFALLAGVWGISVLVGPLVGGVFASLGDWRGAFYTVAGIGIVLSLVVLRVLPRPRREASEGDRIRLPAGRVALLCAAIAAISLAAVAGGSGAKAGFIVMAIGMFAAMVAVDRRSKQPLLPSDAFSPVTMTGLAIWAALLVSVSFTAMPTYVPLFLQRLHGFDPLSAGYSVASASLSWTLTAIFVSGVSAEGQRRLIVIGPSLMAVGLTGVAVFAPSGPPPGIIASMMVVGCGMGSCWAFLAGRMMSGAREGEADIAAGAIATVQQSGFATGAALAGLAANVAGMAGGDSAEAVAAAALLTPAALACIAALGALAAFRLSLLPDRPATE
ncbi:MFS transporter [Minwuia thermotolerans]|uniref:MFS transporter n=1 Tax=Minwuia thermotolerans TaxID=2056226 RepID=UPI000F63D92B|nr:MFS transporter [Minwuia thermotolerans]